MCNLVENYPAHHADGEDFRRTLKFSYLYAKTVTLMATHDLRTNAIIARNRRIGCSMSDVVSAVAKFGRRRFLEEFCDQGFRYVRDLDKQYSDWLGVPRSIRRTASKPSGTVSLVAGCAGAGMHWPKMRTGYRTVRVQNVSELLPALREAGYRVEPSVTDPLTTSVVYFPWVTPDGVLDETQVSIWEQFKMASDLQEWWSDNQVSCTVGFTRAEAEAGLISRCLTAFDGQLKGISLLPKSEDGATPYPQMPYTPAPREEVEVYAASLRSLDFTGARKQIAEDASGVQFCDGDSCTI